MDPVGRPHLLQNNASLANSFAPSSGHFYKRNTENKGPRLLKSLGLLVRKSSLTFLGYLMLIRLPVACSAHALQDYCLFCVYKECQSVNHAMLPSCSTRHFHPMTKYTSRTLWEEKSPKKELTIDLAVPAVLKVCRESFKFSIFAWKRVYFANFSTHSTIYS